MKRWTWGVAALFAVALIGEARADLVTYDGFAGGAPGSDLVGTGGGTGFAGSWTPGGFNATSSTNFGYAAGSLAFGDLVTSGDRVSTDATQVIAGVERPLSQAIGPNDTFYLSVLLRPEGTVGAGAFGGFFGLCLNSTNGDANELFFGKPGAFNQYDLETRGGTGRSVSNYTAVSGETTLLVLKGELQAGNDVFTLWVDRPLGGGDPVSFDARKTDLDLGSFNSLIIYSTGAFSVDEIRIGRSYADVTPTAVPEPPSLLLGASVLTGMLLVVRRRRGAGLLTGRS